jgi:hypothetical protein
VALELGAGDTEMVGERDADTEIVGEREADTETVGEREMDGDPAALSDVLAEKLPVPDMLPVGDAADTTTFGDRTRQHSHGSCR